MKKTLLVLFLGVTLWSCKNDTPNDYVTLSGKITNKEGDTLKISTLKNKLIKNILIADDGTFKDTFKVSEKNYVLLLDGEYARLYLNNGDDIKLNLDTKSFDETLTFTGEGSAENNYFIKKMLLQEKAFEYLSGLSDIPRSEYTAAMDSIKEIFTDLLKDQKGFDTDFIQSELDDRDSLFAYLDKQYERNVQLNALVGKPSPVFTDYENYDGNTTSLSDLKGKYIYVDVWATWCKPCLAEIPALKDLEAELGEQMYFVSISIDKVDKHDAWKKMVKEKELKGIQLFADQNWKSQFVKDYFISGIPRFLIIDPNGNVVKPDAPRPSNPKTKVLLLDLLKS